MFGKPSIMTRIAVGKGVGLIFGLMAFFMIPAFAPGVSPLIHWGVLFWYVTMGAIIGMYGVLNWNPMLKFSMPWWVMGPLIGGWMNFVLAFFAYDALRTITISFFGAAGTGISPFWIVLEGVIIGGIIDYLCTRFGGEGIETVTAVTPPEKGGASLSH
ncbi:MAG: hypothetical protein EP348_03155 [Alphaproteobacteria bacterium]|nr:MAG: hypothetical protein EP348_03155 [Alphaproteobacteria bacterium]